MKSLQKTKENLQKIKYFVKNFEKVVVNFQKSVEYRVGGKNNFVQIEKKCGIHSGGYEILCVP